MSGEVTGWLHRLGLGQYAEVFSENAIVWDDLADLDHGVLKDIGVSAAGHRLQILRAVKSLSEEEASALSSPANESVQRAVTAGGEAERRRLTVMFCDLVGSTELSRQLDPEEMREVNRAFERSCESAITRYEGFLARYMGDGVLAYFGFPRAHEDAAERAIHSGLVVIDSVPALSTTALAELGETLRVRVGIETGPVVVELIGDGPAQESAISGDTPSLANRLQSLADENTVVIGPGTRTLAGDLFDCEDLGGRSLKGFEEPVRAWRVIASLRPESRFEARQRAGLTPLVGREHEVSSMLEHWSRTTRGEGQVILLSGEAGIGKSRILETVREQVADDNPTTLRYQCSPYYVNTALYPVIEQLQRSAGFKLDDSNSIKLHKLQTFLGARAEAFTLFASLLSIDTDDDRESVPPEIQKERILTALVSRIDTLCNEGPILLMFEDLHWADPTSLEFLSLLIEHTPGRPVLSLLTFRPEFVPPWPDQEHITRLALERLTATLISTMVSNVTGHKSLPDAVLEQIISKTDGVPLFVEELTKTVLESPVLAEETGRYVVNGSLEDIAIPATLHDSLMARLDHLGDARALAQTAAVIGREFDYDLLATMSPLESGRFRKALDQLLEAELVFRVRGSHEEAYTFKHALVQDVAYGSLLKSTRRTLHQLAAQSLQNRFPERVETQPELIAHHLTEAGESGAAVDYWLKAGQRAVARSGNQEAIQHLEKGLLLLKTVSPSGERARDELDLLRSLYSPVVALQGYNSDEIPRMCAKIRALCELTGESEGLRQAVYEQVVHNAVSGRYEDAKQSAEELVQLADESKDAESLLQGHRTLGWLTLLLGELPRAAAHLEKAVELYDHDIGLSLASRYGHSPYVAALSASAVHRWLVGYPARAFQIGAEAIEHARDLGHVMTLCYGLNFHALRAAMARYPQAALNHARACMTLASEHKIVAFDDHNRVVLGWASILLGDVESGMRDLKSGFELQEESGERIFQTLMLGLRAEAYLDVGDWSTAEDTLVRAIQIIEKSGERWYEAEIRRLHGELHITQGSLSQGEATLRGAIDVARRLGEKSLELRSATSLARFWQGQGKEGDARDLLTPVYDWFTEGFDTPDLHDAKTLLETLS